MILMLFFLSIGLFTQDNHWIHSRWSLSHLKWCKPHFRSAYQWNWSQDQQQMNSQFSDNTLLLTFKDSLIWTFLFLNRFFNIKSIETPLNPLQFKFNMNPWSLAMDCTFKDMIYKDDLFLTFHIFQFLFNPESCMLFDI